MMMAAIEVSQMTNAGEIRRALGVASASIELMMTHGALGTGPLGMYEPAPL